MLLLQARLKIPKGFWDARKQNVGGEVKNGKFTARYFNDDGESFEYLNNNCVKLEFDVNCDNGNVNVVVNNKGNVKLTPKIKLVSTDSRKLNVTVK